MASRGVEEDRLAVERTTGFPASILAQLAAKGELGRGAVIQKRDVPARPVIEALARRGIRVREA